MKIDKGVLKAVTRAASTELGRYAIDGVHLAPSRGILEATDGRMLLRGAVTEGKDDHDRIIGVDSLKTVLADKSRPRATDIEISSNGSLNYIGSLGPVPMATRDCEFPTTTDIIPTDEQVGFKVTFAGHLLAILAAAARDVDHAAECVTFEFQKLPDGQPDPTKGVRVTMGADFRKVVGIIMPMSL